MVVYILRFRSLVAEFLQNLCKIVKQFGSLCAYEGGTVWYDTPKPYLGSDPKKFQ